VDAHNCHNNLLCGKVPPQKITAIMLRSSVQPITNQLMKWPGLSLFAAGLP
jgi:hypothetical protein